MKPQNPLSGRINLFPFYQQLIWSVGGFCPLVESEPSAKRTGRRDIDKKPRQYPLNNEKYGKDPRTGTIWRRAA